MSSSAAAEGSKAYHRRAAYAEILIVHLQKLWKSRKKDSTTSSLDRPDEMIIPPSQDLYRSRNNHRQLASKGKCDESSEIPGQLCNAIYESRATHTSFYSPWCFDTSLSGEVSAIIGGLRLGFSWIALLPSRVGWDRCVNASLRALCDVVRYSSLSPAWKGSVADDWFARSYGRAIRSLRYQVQDPNGSMTDQTLLSVCVMALVDYIRAESTEFGTGKDVCAQHHKAIETILLSRPRTKQPTELTRALVHIVWVQGFHVPVASGSPSPYEDPYWHTMEPLVYLSPEISTLRRCFMQIFATLPRLIADIRLLREGQESDDDIPATHPETLTSVSQLAKQLLQLEDESAESFALHHVHVVKTEMIIDRHIVPYCFVYPNTDALLDVLPYWHARLQVYRTCRFLQSMGWADFGDRSCLTSETRISKNILMSWPQILGPGNIGSGSGGIIMQSAVFIWGSLSGRTTFQNTSTSALQDWILDKLDGPRLSRQAMDAAADVLVGGPIHDHEYEAAVPIPPAGAPATTLVAEFLKRNSTSRG